MTAQGQLSAGQVPTLTGLPAGPASAGFCALSGSSSGAYAAG